MDGVENVDAAEWLRPSPLLGLVFRFPLSLSITAKPLLPRSTALPVRHSGQEREAEMRVGL